MTSPVTRSFFKGPACLLWLALAAASSGALAQFGGGGGEVGGDLTKFPKELKNLPAMHLAHPTRAQMLGAARAGSRVVAVGDHGTVLLSDDQGKSWRQARDVPTRVLLTSVSFVNDKLGWASGHWGLVLHTEDGGETWKIQRSDTTVDQPLFSVYFSDASNGIAVGLWSLAVRTTDGGATWTPVKFPQLSATEKAGPNLYDLVPAKGSVLYVAAEQGLVYRSADGGATWVLLKTGNKGSFWTGLALADDSVLMAGLNGKIWRSTDAGKTWLELTSGVTASITDLALAPDGGVTGVGLEGTVVTSKDGVTFTAAPRADRAPLTAVLVTAKGSPLLFSKDGVVESN
jgi:photosystem II stability/assembly factor-like uncharacterized protein